MPHGNKMFTIACPEIFSGVNADNTTKEQIEQSELKISEGIMVLCY